MATGNWLQVAMLTDLSWNEVVDLIFSKNNTASIRYAAEKDAAEALQIEEVGEMFIPIVGFEYNEYGLVVIGNWGNVEYGAAFYFWVSKVFPPRPMVHDHTLQILKPDKKGQGPRET